MAEVKAVLPELLPGKDTEDGTARAGREDGCVDGDLRNRCQASFQPGTKAAATHMSLEYACKSTLLLGGWLAKVDGPGRVDGAIFTNTCQRGS